MTLQNIDDPADPRLAPYRGVRERDLVGRQGMFIAEGRFIVATLLAGGRFRAQSVLVSPQALESIREDLENAADPPEAYVASVETMSAVAGFHIHRGCLAIGERPADLALPDLLPQDNGRALLVALEDLSNHDNVGAVFRNGAAFGCRGVLLSERCCDPLYRKSIRVSMGAALRLPFARSADFVRDLTALADSDVETVALVTDPDATPIEEHVRSAGPRVALVVGAEGPGLTMQALDACTARVRIPTTDRVD